MKKIIFILFLAALVGCKKNEAIPDVIDCTIDTEIWRSDNYKQYHGLDSVRIEVCLYGDTIPQQSVYTNASGTVTVQLKKGTSYTLRSISRTYKNGSSNPYHYSSTDTFSSSIEDRSGNIIRKNIIIYYYSQNAGLGCTYSITQDPCYN